MNLIERIDHWGQVAPDRLAHISGDRTLTYGDLVRRSNTMAVYLAATLPDDHSPVAVPGHKEPELLVAFLGALKAGHPYIPIDAVTTPAQRLERIVNTAAAPLILTPERIAALTETDAGPAPDPSWRVGTNDPFYIMFTSGSTGDPKGVIITLGCVMSFLNWIMAEQGFVEQAETFLNQVPFSFDLSIMDIYASLATGGTMFSVTHEDIDNPAQLYRTLARSDATIWFSTPSFAQVCLVERSFSAEMMPRLRRLLFCGETLPPETAATLLERFPEAEVWNTYGPTETTVATTSIRIDREILARYQPLPIGYPKPDGRIVVLGEDGRPVADGERGEIVIAGPNVSPGYAGRPDLTARAFFDLDGMPAYHTGDWGHYQGNLLFCEGRRDSQIKLHGHRIEIGDVEANLQTLPGVRDGVVVPKLKDGRPDWLAAFVILAEQPDGSEFEVSRALRKHLGTLLPAYMLPRKFYFMTTFPMTANGKADRKKLAGMIE
jgi:D-alanine--poly(phosphoribitol) ligase subunit 1